MLSWIKDTARDFFGQTPRSSDRAEPEIATSPEAHSENGNENLGAGDMVSIRRVDWEGANASAAGGGLEKCSINSSKKRKRHSNEIKVHELEETSPNLLRASQESGASALEIYAVPNSSDEAARENMSMTGKVSELPLRSHETSRASLLRDEQRDSQDNSVNRPRYSHITRISGVGPEINDTPPLQSSVEQIPTNLPSQGSGPTQTNKHMRFPSEEPFVPETQLEATESSNLTNGAQITRSKDSADEQDEEEEDDDEAPEAISKTTGEERAHAAAAVVAQAARRQEEAKKNQRREKDARLKDQSETARKLQERRDRTARRRAAANEKKTDSSTKTIARELLRSGSLPDFLPPEILEASESGDRISTQQAEQNLAAPRPNKRRLLDVDEKPPKDIRVGSKIVRVLETQRKTLPPKASKQSRNIRESWLSGQRRGASTRDAGARIPPGIKGFVRG